MVSCQRINLLNHRDTWRKWEAPEEGHQQMSIEVSDAGRHSFQKWTTNTRRGWCRVKERIRNSGEGCKRRECARRNVNLPNEILAAVRDIGLIFDNDHVKRVYVAEARRGGWVNRKIREISNQLDFDSAAAIGERNFSAVRECLLIAWSKRKPGCCFLDGGAEVNSQKRAENWRSRIGIRDSAGQKGIANTHDEVKGASAHKDAGRPSGVTDIAGRGGQTIHKRTATALRVNNGDTTRIQSPKRSRLRDDQVILIRLRDSARCPEAGNYLRTLGHRGCSRKQNGRGDKH